MQRNIPIDIPFSGNDSLMLEFEDSLTTFSSSNGHALANLSLPFYQNAGRYPVIIRNNNDILATKYIEILPLLAFDIDSSSLSCNISAGSLCFISGDINLSTHDKSTVVNHGNTQLSFSASASSLNNGRDTLPLSSLGIALGSMETAYLSQTPIDLPVVLFPGSSSLLPLAVSFSTPSDAAKGSYTGSITLIGDVVE